MASVGIGGVDCWGKDGVLIPDLAAIEWDDEFDRLLVLLVGHRPGMREAVEKAIYDRMVR
ncbi:MAG: hypothetical protein WD066_14110 [Planctomycetaceae bacterium]